jgi:hypothetical protein
MISRARHHLAAVAHAEREGVGAAKNARSSSRARALNRIDLAQPSPAPSTSPYEKPPQAASPRKPSSSTLPRAGRSCARRGLEAGAVERRGHLDLAVDALLAQHRDRGRAPAAMNGAATSSVGSKVTAGRALRASSSRAHAPRRRRRVIAQPLHRARWSPTRRAQVDQRLVEDRSPPTRCVTSARGGPADRVTPSRPSSPCRASTSSSAASIRDAHLQHRAELFGEQSGERVAERPIQFDLEAAVAGEGHLDQRGEQAAVGAVVIGERLPSASRAPAIAANPCEGAGSSSRAARPELSVDLRQRRAAEPRLAARRGRPASSRSRASSSRSSASACGARPDRRERRDDQRDGADHTRFEPRPRARRCASTASPCPPGWRCRAPGRAPRRPLARWRTAARPRPARRTPPSSWPRGARRQGAMSAASRLVSASPTAMRADAARRAARPACARPSPSPRRPRRRNRRASRATSRPAPASGPTIGSR